MKTRIVPVRKYGHEWIEVPSHRATAWAAYLGDKLIGRYARRMTAAQNLDAAAKHSAKPATYRLGSRMGERVRGTLYISGGKTNA